MRLLLPMMVAVAGLTVYSSARAQQAVPIAYHVLLSGDILLDGPVSAKNGEFTQMSPLLGGGKGGRVGITHFAIDQHGLPPCV